ncbi:MAG TPA: helix-turn-helix domain-containing protein [Polyangiaceae bacterium]
MTTLLRLSQLARFWEKNPRTIQSWIRLGRLAAIRSPGGHFRVRVADVRAFCEREGMPLPPFAAPAVRRVVVAGAALARSVRIAGVTVEAREDPCAALLAVADGSAAALVLPPSAGSVDVAAAVAALRRHAATRSLPVIVAGKTTRTRARTLEQAGATRVLGAADGASLPAVLRASLGLE